MDNTSSPSPQTPLPPPGKLRRWASETHTRSPTPESRQSPSLIAHATPCSVPSHSHSWPSYRNKDPHYPSPPRFVRLSSCHCLFASLHHCFVSSPSNLNSIRINCFTPSFPVSLSHKGPPSG